MNKLTVSVLVGAATLFTGIAQAAPLTNGTPAFDNGVQNVRMVCNENGRCWRERRERTVIIQNRDSYNYAPRERYIERGQRHHDRGPGVGIHAPGVSIGVGGGGHRY